MNSLSTSHVFISYSRRDTEVMLRIVSFLRGQGIKVWLDNERLVPGTPIWEEEIEKAINNAYAVVVVLSPDSKGSEWVRREITLTEQNKKRIFPVLVRGDENSSISLRLITRQFVDLRKDEARGLKSLYEAISQYLGENDSQKVEPSPVKPVLELPPPTKRKPANWLPIAIGVIIFLVMAFAFYGFTQLINLPAMLQKNTGGTETITGITPVTTNDSTTSVLVASEPLIAITPTTSGTVSYPPEMTDESGIEMVFVPAGKFNMGSNNGNPDEKPVHSVYLDDFYIDKFEVTNRLYRTCVKAKVCDPPKRTNSYTRGYYYGNTAFDNYPVVNIDWSMAQTFCQWRGASLPTEAEWEKAARSTDERKYPWGNSIDCSYASYLGKANGCVKDTSQVGKYPNGLSPYGAFDMAGNVWEWVSSIYSPYPYSPSDGREDLSSSGNRVLRGGSWNVDGDAVSTTHRYQYDPSGFDGVIGFRCASTP